MRTNSKRVSAFCPHRHLLSLRLPAAGPPAAGSRDHVRPTAACRLHSGRNLKKGKRRDRLEDPLSQDWSPAEEEGDKDEDGGAGSRNRHPSLAAGRPRSRRWGRPAAARARVSPSRARSLRLPPPLRPELSHRCPATILGWPQTRTRIAFGQSVAKPLSSGPRSPAGLRFAP